MIPFIKSFTELMLITDTKESLNEQTDSKELNMKSKEIRVFLTMFNDYITSSNCEFY